MTTPTTERNLLASPAFWIAAAPGLLIWGVLAVLLGITGSAA